MDVLGMFREGTGTEKQIKRQFVVDMTNPGIELK